jgi:protein-disulfide isomerase
MQKKIALIAIIVGIIGIAIGSYSIIYITNNSLINTTSKDVIDLSRAAEPIGSKNAPITIVEFGDYQCSHCHRWYIDNKPALQGYIDNGKVNFYFLDFPIFGIDSYNAAEATYCAADQGKYWEYHDILFKNQKIPNDGWASKANLIQFAYQLGLDTVKFKECLDNNTYKDRVEFNKSIGEKNGVNATPAFLIIKNSDKSVTKIRGNQPVEEFKLDTLLNE